jgi:hypothetical protein
LDIFRPKSLPSDRSCLLLHAGAPKTGTDSIQRCFSYYAKDNFKLIADQFELLRSQGDESCNLSKYTHEIEQSYKRPSPDTLISYITNRKLCKEFIGSGKKHLVFSSEQAGRPSLTLRGAKSQYDFLRFFSDEPWCLYYMRDPVSQCLALISQSLKMGANHLNIIPHFLHSQPNVRNVIFFDALYGRSNVICVPFDPPKFTNEDILFDFCGRLGISSSEAKMTAFLQSFNRSNANLPIVLLQLLSNLYQRIAIPYSTRLSLADSLSDLVFAGRKANHDDFMSSDQISGLYESSKRDYDELGGYLGFEPYPRSKPCKEAPHISEEQADRDHSLNSSQILIAADKVRDRLVRVGQLGEDELKDPLLSSLESADSPMSLSAYLDFVENIRIKQSLPPRAMCQASLVYLVNLTHIWAEYTKRNSTFALPPN